MNKLIFLRFKMKQILLYLLNVLENNGNTDISTNGEKKFTQKLLTYYGDAKVTIFDVGANVGEYTEELLKSDTNSVVHVFEPQKSCIPILKKKFSSYPNVYINNFGCSDTNTKAIIYQDKKASGLTSLYNRNLSFYDLKLSRKIHIQLKRLDWYISQKAIKKIHLLKMDVEGHELFVLKGLGKYLHPKYIDFIQFEYGGANLDSHTNLLDFYTFLDRKGYVIYKIMRTELEKRPYNPTMENYAYQNFVAVSKKVSRDIDKGMII